MDSWVNLILQWVKCLQDRSDCCINTLEELQDGEIYYMLINKLKPWNRNEYCDSKKGMILQYLKDEYPNFKFQKINTEVQHVCMALLILSRLSLEPIFHKSLCTNLNVDLQIKIKSILESIYSLGKNVTEEEFCKTFSLCDKTDLKTFSTKSKHVLHEFLNSPVIRSVHSEKKMFEQSKQLRHLRADLETMRYEKSELIEDIKTQRKKIEELQNKLQDSLVELKILRQENSADKLCCSCKSDTKFDSKIESAYQKEVESLEKYVAELQNDNCLLQDEKNDLTNQVKSFKEKYSEIEGKNLNNEQILETMYVQMEKKEEELTEIKMRYEELRNYFIERSMNLNHQSFEFDDKLISEISLNKSETLSSVIEIQLQETKKEMEVIQNEFQYLNAILTAVMEEYVKLKKKFDLISINTTEKISEKEEAPEIVKDVNQRTVINFTKEEIFIPNKIELLFTLVFRDHSTRNKNISCFLNLLNTSGICKDIKKSKKNVSFEPCKEIIASNNSEFNNNSIHGKNKFIENVINFDESKSLTLYNNNNVINHNAQKLLITFYETLSEENWHNEPVCFVKRLTKTIKILAKNKELIKLLNKSLTEKEIAESNKIFDSIRNDAIENSKNVHVNNEHSNVLIFNENDLKVLQMTWISLYESIHNNLKIHKIFILLEKNWHLIFESFKDILKYVSDNDSLLNELYIKKGKIENELQISNFKNFQALSMNLIAAVHFSTTFSKTINQKPAYDHKQSVALTETSIHSILDTSAFNFEDHHKLNIQKEYYISKRIINIKRRIDNFDKLITIYKEKEILNPEPKCIEINSKESEEPSIMVASDDVDISKTKEFQHYIKEVHEKYELKLEKMKEKMKSVYNNQISTIKKEQEIIAKKQLDILQHKFDKQCQNHTEELKKYKKHITDLTSQLWEVGDKLINEKQKKETYEQKLNEIKVKYDNSNTKNVKFIKTEPECFSDPIIIQEKKSNTRNSFDSDSENKMESVRGFQIMGNAFSTEDEEGEVFDTTYLTDMQRSRYSLSTIDMNRLSILQMRNAKCKPHLKSSYPAEMNFHPVPCTEDEIKTGTAEEVFNDSLSQSLLTGKKVKRKDRTRNSTETPKARRFSNIFRKPRLSVDRGNNKDVFVEGSSDAFKHVLAVEDQ